jgi:hypothetical protein
VICAPGLAHPDLPRVAGLRPSRIARPDLPRIVGLRPSRIARPDLPRIVGRDLSATVDLGWSGLVDPGLPGPRLQAGRVPFLGSCHRPSIDQDC